MSTNETENIDSTNNETELELELPPEKVEETQPKEPVAPIVTETPEAKLARLERMAAQQRKKLNIPEPQPKQESISKPGELGFAEEAYLLANEINEEEIPLAQEILKKTGMTLRELVKDDYFKAKLKTFREEKASAEAIPKGSKRSSPSPKDSVEYWIKKPFNEVPADMRIAVVNAKLEKEKSRNPFAN